jgi:hypothetical protein
VVGDAGAHPRVGREEAVHLVLVAGEDDDEILPLVLHHLEEDLDRFLAVVALVLGPMQVVGLVDEEHPAHGPLEDLLGLGRGVADVLAHQLVPGDRHQVAPAQVAQAVEQLAHPHGHRGLARPRRAGEAHVERGPGGVEPEAAPEPVDEEEGGDLPDAGLDRDQSDQLPVEAVEDGVDGEGPALGVDVDERVGGQRTVVLLLPFFFLVVVGRLRPGFGPGATGHGHGEAEPGAASVGRALAHHPHRPLAYRSPAGRSVA